MAGNTRSHYEMHKYWGKKPSNQLAALIDRYSSPGDIVLDPFAGYGVFVCEAYIKGRNAIGNDLNPFSSFMQQCLLSADIQLDKFEKKIAQVLHGLEDVSRFWYGVACPLCSSRANVLASLRCRQGKVLRHRLRCSCQGTSFEVSCDFGLVDKEFAATVPNHPVGDLILNGRINVKRPMTTDDLFPIRALICHSLLFSRLQKIQDQTVRRFALLAFSSNLANCSKLVPPISTRGPMYPGAWMTGFYIGKTFIENNVFHYFGNRIAKVVAGKRAFLQQESQEDLLCTQKQVSNIRNFTNRSRGYLICNHDAKRLPFPENSVDYVFTDPPYGDSVPYFEQSILWNTWLGHTVDYSQEIVISNSKSRAKNSHSFGTDIARAIVEVYRVLKQEGFFSLTFHSISGVEWYALTKACLQSGFFLVKWEWLTQKTFSPRQLNRKKTVKGDVLMTFQKRPSKPKTTDLNLEETISLVLSKATAVLGTGKKNTNDLFMEILQEMFSNHFVFTQVSFLGILSEHFYLDKNGFWHLPIK